MHSVCGAAKGDCAHLGVPPLVSQSSQNERITVSMAISYTAKKISAMMNPVKKQMATGSTGLGGSTCTLDRIQDGERRN